MTIPELSTRGPPLSPVQEAVPPLPPTQMRGLPLYFWENTQLDMGVIGVIAFNSLVLLPSPKINVEPLDSWLARSYSFFFSPFAAILSSPLPARDDTLALQLSWFRAGLWQLREFDIVALLDRGA